MPSARKQRRRPGNQPTPYGLTVQPSYFIVRARLWREYAPSQGRPGNPLRRRRPAAVNPYHNPRDQTIACLWGIRCDSPTKFAEKALDRPLPLPLTSSRPVNRLCNYSQSVVMQAFKNDQSCYSSNPKGCIDSMINNASFIKSNSLRN